MGVVTIVFFFVMLPVVLIASGPFGFGAWEIIALAIMGGLGFGGLMGTLYLIEPERGEKGDAGAH